MNSYLLMKKSKRLLNVNFRKVFIMFLINLFLFKSLVFANTGTTIIVEINNPMMTVNGVSKEIETGNGTKPIIVNNRTLLPIRSIIETLGGTVLWNGNKKSVDIKLSGTGINLTIGSKVGYINGISKNLDVGPSIINGRTMVPLRFIIENLGAKVKWDQDKKRVTIEYKTGSSSDQSLSNSILINDQLISKDKYIERSVNNDKYILLEKDQFKYSFKIPMEFYKTGYYLYPEVDDQNGEISIDWKNSNGEGLTVKMNTASSNLTINGIPQEPGVPPEVVNGKLYIPINVFISLFNMKITNDTNLNLATIQASTDFEKSKIIGSWTDIDSSILSVLTDGAGIIKDSPSSAMGYKFNSNGTYSFLGYTIGSIYSGLIVQNGNYKIIGQTIVFTNIVETLYKGKSLELSYKDKKLEDPAYSFISNYKADEKKIEIDITWFTLK